LNGRNTTWNRSVVVSDPVAVEAPAAEPFRASVQMRARTATEISVLIFFVRMMAPRYEGMAGMGSAAINRDVHQ
jgi:hypothetical protein